MTRIGKGLAVVAAVVALGAGAALAQGTGSAGAPAGTPVAAGPAGYGPVGYRGAPMMGGWGGGPAMMRAWGRGGPSDGWFRNMVSWCTGARR